MRGIVFIFVLFISCQVNAITDEELKNIAMSKLGSNELEIKKRNSTYCIIQPKNGSGYIIIDLKEDAEGRIMAFSTESNWKEEYLPPVVLDWFEKYQRACKEVKNLQNNSLKGKSVSPLLTCHWHQNSPYNDLSPVIEDGNVKTAAGCVAIAAAQIAYYWRKDNPLYTLKDTPTYIYGGAPVNYVIPKGSPNKWDLMLDTYTDSDSQDSRNAVAQLCYVIGTTSYLNYASSTGGSIRDAANALYSQYNLLSNYVSRNKIDYSEWVDILYGNLIKGYPVMCSGIGSGGHAFVLDGYDSETGLFHFNFGWGGAGDGYYPVDDSEDSMGGFSIGQSIVYDIHPSSRNIEASLLGSYDKNKSVINVISTIKNNSTLPIRQLYIYAVPESSTLEETESPIWEGVEIKNDGIEYSISIEFNISKDSIIKLFLTDENKYELAHYYIDIDNSIKNIIYKERNNCIYDLTGKKAFNNKIGVYINVNG
ncbi:MAG: C10 family peptidase, partial [Aeriscardovia sp.]|nr:C10 family peptidase [Aeriscardovia sp.]